MKYPTNLSLFLVFILTLPIFIPSGFASEPLPDGLLDSAWPMFHHDSKHSGRSPYAPTGNCPIEKWKLPMHLSVISSPVLDQNGTLYIGGEFGEAGFFALNPDGSEKWKAEIGGILESAAIGSDGTIYVGTVLGNLHALYPNGTQRWQVNLNTDSWTVSAPVIDQNGIIYTASVQSSSAFAIYPNGTIKWQFPTNGWIYSHPALADDGTIYIGSNDHNLYAINTNGTMRWKYAAGDCIQEGPAIDPQGNIYFGSWDGHFYSLYPNGTLRWKFNTYAGIDSSPAITVDGALIIGNNAGKLHCFNPDGTLRWSFNASYQNILSSPAIDARGTIYYASDSLYALDSNGTLLWKYAAGTKITSSPIIAEDGTIYLGGDYWQGNSILFALGSINDTKPATPSVLGTESGHVRRRYDYTITSTDPEDDNLSYYINWDDDTTTDWTNLTASGQGITLTHKWTKRGDYSIKAKARDEHGMESDWGTLSITMPYQPPRFPIITWILDRFPNSFPLLHRIFS